VPIDPRAELALLKLFFPRCRMQAANPMKILRLLIILPFLPALVGCVEHAPTSAAVIEPDIKNEPSATGAVLSDQPTTSQADDSLLPSDAAKSASAEPSETAKQETAVAPLSPSAAKPVGKAPPADRTPTRPGDAQKITFDDLNLGMQADVVFRPFMLTDRVNELEGTRISIIGYMHPGQLSQRGIKDFVLLKNTECKFGPGGQADHLANVILREGKSTSFTPSPLKVEGTLKIEPFQGPDNNTWSIYRLENAEIR